MASCNGDSAYGNGAVEKQRIAQAIVDKFAELGIAVEPADIAVGAAFTRYFFNLLSLKKRMCDVIRCSDAIQAHLQSPHSVIIYSSVDWLNTFVVEVANKERRIVELSTLLSKPQFQKADGELTFILGEDVRGDVVLADLAQLPHLLVAGTTGSGKTTFLNSLIVSLICKYSPAHVRLLAVNVNSDEMSRFNGIPHLSASKAITTLSDAISALNRLIIEVETRLELLHRKGVRSVAEYNKSINPKAESRLPYLVLVMDEFVPVMAYDKRAFETKLIKLSQTARAAGIHLVLSTQYSDPKFITGTVKASFGGKAVFKQFSAFGSRIVFDGGCAEKLIGQGDMFFSQPSNPFDAERVQCAYISETDLRAIVRHCIETDA